MIVPETVARPRSGTPALSVDDAYAFATTLRLDPQSLHEPDRQLDWGQAPWPVKVYEGGCRLGLGAHAPSDPARPRLSPLGKMLFWSLGTVRVRWDVRGALPSTRERPTVTGPLGRRLIQRRAIPSGGAAYPTEAYVVGNDESRAVSGAYHYDAYRHELVDLAHPAPMTALRRALGLSSGTDWAPLVLVLTNRFSKNAFKYGDFAYRLGSVDVGVALGRVARMGRALFDAVEIRLDFPDADLNALLGIDGAEESAYAVVALGPPVKARAEDTTAAGALRNPPAVRDRAASVPRSARFDAMHAAASRPLAPCSRRAPEPPGGDASEPALGELRQLPAPLSVDLLDSAVLGGRTSNGHLFTGAPVGAGALATVLECASSVFSMLLACCVDALGPGPGLLCAVQRVPGVAPGWYRYVPAAHALTPVGAGPSAGCGQLLQEALHAGIVNIELAAFTVHFTAPLDFRRSDRLVRDYRVQHMLVGAAVEATTVASRAVRLGSHPLLGFDARVVDDAYGLGGSGWGVQVEVCVGDARSGPWLEGRVLP
jgi:SagB-type dehydrogenase family enzyme